MTQSRRKTALVVVGMVLLSAWIASCSGSAKPTEAGTEGGALPTNTTKVTTTGGTAAGQCTGDAIKKAVDAKYPEATIRDQNETLSFGIATVFPKDGPKKGVVAFFQIDGASCALVKEADPTGDVQAEAPADFPKTLIDQWKRQYVDPTKPTSTTTSTTESSSGGGTCGNNDGGACTTTTSSSTTTTTKPTTTTTKRPSTTTSTGPPQTIIIR